MEPSDNHSIAKSWIAMHLAGSGTKVYEENFWAFEKLDDLIHKDPHRALEIIKAIIKADSSELILSNLGAGQIEDLMCYNDAAVIDDIQAEAEAEANLLFKKAMSSTWLDSSDTKHLERFYKIAGIQPPLDE
ncbi:DUF6869 domain-containing protein [Candidatus Thiodiazotropha endoloripes]|uniref:DUF6869 domain-containing protein n=1 Tax=Candidatus Thiodiazotropha endoloripes TaxID=1818881 RepID=A0A1E2UND7_9GAMM|nr:hypothetical protein [Candidatus Thiodiazotropha endoloripes]ODB96268.1 hypothetical protein A3196_05515 [Candidatus Thiodiazotropha endoloripes]